MDREQQAECVRQVIDSIAEGALALPPEARLAFIKAEIVKVRGDFSGPMRLNRDWLLRPGSSSIGSTVR